MVSGREGDTYDRGPRRQTGQANEGGLRALGEQIDGGGTSEPVANEGGLRALGEQIDAAYGAPGAVPASASGGSRGAGPGGGAPPRPPGPAGPRGPGSGGGRGGRRPPPPPGRRRNGKRRWSTRRKVGTGIAILLLLIVAVAGAGYGYIRYEWDQVHKSACKDCVAVVSGKPFNVLLIGSDTRAGDTGQAAQQFGSASAVGGQRSDTIKILHVDPGTGAARMLSIPRDTYVTMSGLPESSGLTGAQKINTAFNNGPDALIKTIENTFGIPISDFIVINFDGVINSVNALGGINLDFKYPVRDDNDGTNESGLNITQTGCQLLNGSQVLSLSRSRYYEYYTPDDGWQMDPGYDLSRIARQNIIIDAMIAKAKSTYNPLTLHSFIDSMVHNVSINNGLSLGTIYSLAEQYHAFSPSSLQSWTLPTLGEVSESSGDVEVVNTQVPNDYVDTIAQFLGGPAGPVTTPPLDQYGEPISVPTTTTTTVPPPTTAGKKHSGTTATVPAETTTTLPDYDPTLC